MHSTEEECLHIIRWHPHSRAAAVQSTQHNAALAQLLLLQHSTFCCVQCAVDNWDPVDPFAADTLLHCICICSERERERT